MSSDDLLAALAARAADAVVLRGASGNWSAAAVLEEVSNLATLLADCRVLAVLADNSPEWVVADLAARRAGCVHLPLPAFFNQEQLAHALDQTGADALLTDQPARVDALQLGFAAIATWRGLAWMRRVCPPATLPPGTAKVSFTSGSTGTPKGVCLSAEGLRQTAAALVATLGDLSISRHLAVLPLALLLENVAGVYAPLLRGAEIVLPGLAQLGWRGMAGFDAGALSRAVATARPHSLILVPELLKAWLSDANRDTAYDSLRFVAVGGARCDAALLASARDSGLPVYEGYGLTECGSVVSLNHPGADHPGSVGQPLPHVRVSVDSTREIRVGGPCFLGYLAACRTLVVDSEKRPQRVQFLPDSPPHGHSMGQEAGEKWAAAAVLQPTIPKSDRLPGDADKPETTLFSTGDLGHLDHAGYLHLSGRRKNILVTAYGRNVAPEWVEATLTTQPEITQALALGEARPWLAAVLVAAPGVDASALAVAVARANAGLPDYARVGAWIVAAPFTTANGLATGNGRPIRAAITAVHADAINTLYSHKENDHVVL